MSQVMALLPYLGLGTIVASISSVWTRRRLAKVDTEAQAERAPMAAMQAMVQQAIASASAANAQVKTLMENHLAHDREDRDRLIEVLTRQTAAMEQMAKDLMEHRTEERQRSEAFHLRLNAIEGSLGRVEGQTR